MRLQHPPRRVLGPLIALTLAASVACTPPGPEERSVEEMADAVGADVLLHLQRGVAAGVSAPISIVPMPNFYLGPSGAPAKLGTDEPELFTAHSSPWNYLVRVPLVLWGPGFVEPGNSEDPDADLADLAPTYARWLEMDEWPGDGRPLDDGVLYDSTPRLIFTVVVDGMGWNLLRQHPDAWPNLRRIMTRARVFDRATIGSSPSLTAAIHANIGTGTYPSGHGVPGNPYFTAKDPSTLLAPTIGDVWDADNGNDPVVGTISVLQTHLTMVGHGSSSPSGDKDPAVYWDRAKSRWTTAPEHFELPGYLEGNGDLETYERELDAGDGALDGRWIDDEIEDVRSATPAFVRYQGDSVIRAIDDEALGQDEHSDLFYVEFKSPDEAGHIWNMLSAQEPLVLAAVDRQIARIKRALDERVPGGYVLAITADHGQQPVAHEVDGWLVDQQELERDLESEFDGDVKVQSYQVFIEEDTDVDDVVTFLSSYTIGDNIPDGAEGADRVPMRERERLVLAGAFPSDFLAALSDDDIERFGDSEWPEGNYSAPVEAARPSG